MYQMGIRKDRIISLLILSSTKIMLFYVSALEIVEECR